MNLEYAHIFIGRSLRISIKDPPTFGAAHNVSQSRFMLEAIL